MILFSISSFAHVQDAVICFRALELFCVAGGSVIAPLHGNAADLKGTEAPSCEVLPC
jgi:hypothetical protein